MRRITDAQFILSQNFLQATMEYQLARCIKDDDRALEIAKGEQVARVLGYDLYNEQKHGFNALNSQTEEQLEIRHISLPNTSTTWNDYTLEKCQKFAEPQGVFTAVAIWDHCTLICAIYGRDERLGKELMRQLKMKKPDTRKSLNIRLSQFLGWDFEIRGFQEREVIYLALSLVGLKHALDVEDIV